jgi:hypothetical protein
MSPALLWRLFWKDTRYVWPWIVLSWLVLALTMKHSTDYGSWVMRGRQETICRLIAVLAAALLVQRDDPRSTRGFLRTRPVSSLAQFIVKCAVLAVWFIGPFCAERLMILAKLHLGVSWTDCILTAAAAVPPVAAVVFVAVLTALLTRRLGYFVGVFALLTVLYGMADEWRNRLPFHPDWEEWLSADNLRLSREFAFQTAGACSALLVAGIYVRSRSRLRYALALAGGAVATVATLQWWPVNFVSILADADHMAPRQDWPDLKSVVWKWGAVRKNAQGLTEVPHSWGGTGSHIDSHRFEMWGEASGISPSWHINQSAYDAVLELPDGRKIRGHSDSAVGAPYKPEALQSSLGSPQFTNLPTTKSERFSANLLAFQPDDIRGATVGARLSGRVTFEIRRPVVLGSMPVQKGASFTADRRRYTIDFVFKDGNSVKLVFSAVKARIALRGKWQWLDPAVILFNPVRKETAQGGFNTWERQPEGPFDLEKSNCTWSGVDEAWLREAGLYFIVMERGGSMSVPFDFSDIALPKP